jgi:hypothetical protein
MDGGSIFVPTVILFRKAVARMAIKSNLISVKLSDSELAKLKRLADFAGETASGMIRQLIVDARWFETTPQAH